MTTPTRESDPKRRALRTGLQLIAAGGLTEVVDSVAEDLDGTPKALLFLGLAFVVSWAQNELEDAGRIPAILKARASDGDNPIPPVSTP